MNPHRTMTSANQKPWGKGLRTPTEPGSEPLEAPDPPHLEQVQGEAEQLRAELLAQLNQKKDTPK